jgi:hypothetical protein
MDHRLRGVDPIQRADRAQRGRIQDGIFSPRCALDLFFAERSTFGATPRAGRFGSGR